ncbi:MAG: pyridoxal phosphate-dependent aminotransferase [Caldicoprobacterales bacterium]|jgi:alanine-synthesizing transaminase|nr:pyridoxal phosphate-dependent aminotransferase [Clostridiales bacterium]
MTIIKKSHKLDNVLYDIRGPVMDEAKRLEEEGYNIMKLNIGNPAPFGLEAPDEIIHDVIYNIRKAQGYTDSMGIFPARKAVMHYCQEKNIEGVTVNDIYLGNGVSELIMIALQALLDNGDEILIPAPDYPLWTASTNLAGGVAVHYLCDEQSDWCPDIDDIKKKITPNTKGIVVINPNNPTGAVYPKEILLQIVKLAEEHDLILFSDEIYDRIIYEDDEHYALASLTDEVLCVTFNGLSKSHRIAGFRAGWMVLSGDKDRAKDYIEGIHMLASMRLCSNALAQYTIQTALGGYQSINEYIVPGGRLREQRDLTYKMLNDIPGLSCVKPKGAFYAFPKVDVERFNIKDDMMFIRDLLLAKKVLLVQGTGFNWPHPDHFRLVFLPPKEDLKKAINRIGSFLADYRQQG